MGLPAILLNEPSSKEEFRTMSHDALDEWIDQLLPVFDENQKPTLMDLSELFSHTRKKLLGACLQKLIETKYQNLLNQKHSPCPKCGKIHKKRRDQSREIVTMQGACNIIRPWFYCVDCSIGYAPLDQVLELSGKKNQLDIQNKSVKLTAEVPFASSSSLFQDLTGTEISDHFTHDTFKEVGRHAYIEDVIPDKEKITSMIREASTNSWRPILVVAADGALLPTRPKANRDEKRGAGQWKEAKGFRLYLLEKDRIVHLAGWHQIQDHDEFGKDLGFAASLVPQKQVRVALLGDGAGWLWKHMVRCFPKGRQILDYYHCSEHIHKVAKMQYGESPQGMEWSENTMCRLFYGEIRNVIRGLRRMSPENEEAKEEIRKLIGYLYNNRKRIHYRSDRAGGYPIGSGGIESSNKYICHTRMKRSGAWWIKENGNDMLKIRCAIYNGTYDKVFERYKKEHLFLAPLLTIR